MTSAASFLAAALAVGQLPGDPIAVTRSEFIFDTAPFAQCHASTIVQTKDGFTAAWFGGPNEGNPLVGIWLSRLQKFGRSNWTAPVEVANGVISPTERYPCWNPVLFQPAGSGQLLLFYKVGPSPSTWWGVMKTSGDWGRSWSAPRRLPDGILGPIKNKPIQLAGGELLCGSSTENTGWRVHFERTPDLGKTWSKTVDLNDPTVLEAIQPTILTHRNGPLQALGRSRQGAIWQSFSSDNGFTWSPLTLTSLPNPSSGIDAVTLSDGRQLLVFNNTTTGRSPLNVALSDDGLLWNVVLTLENDPGFEFSYPAVIEAKGDGPNLTVHITYTWNRVKIKHVVLSLQRPS